MVKDRDLRTQEAAHQKAQETSHQTGESPVAWRPILLPWF